MNAADFPGFPRDAQPFLADLAAHNDRDWFAAHRATYETAIKAPAEAFVAAMVPIFSELAGRPVSGKVFRIHRDVRFSKDKRPYNAHLHIGFAPVGGTSPKAGGSGFYFGLEPDRLALGAGAFELPPAGVDAWRAAVAEGGEEIAAIVADLAAQGFRLEGPELKRVPAPYPADHPRADLLRRKGITAWRDITDPGVVAGPALVRECEETFARLAPLHLWLDGLAAGD